VPALVAVVVALVGALGLGFASSARADEAALPEEARRLYDEGMAHYAARGFADAARAFHAARALAPRREILFAEAQATRLAGDCPTAVRLYQEFLATQPSPQQVEATRLALNRCESNESLGSAALGRPLPRAAAPAVALPTSALSAMTASPRPGFAVLWWRDRPGLALSSAAGVSLGASLAFALAAARADSDARAATSYDGYQERRLTAEARGLWATRAAVLAGAFAVLAAGRFLWVGLTPGGGAVGGGGRF
jgi:hypothetical protein